MGGGNGQKSKTARERNLQKLKASKGNTLTSSLINMLTFLFNLILLHDNSSLHVIMCCTCNIMIHFLFDLFFKIGSQLDSNKKAMSIQVLMFQFFLSMLKNLEILISENGFQQ